MWKNMLESAELYGFIRLSARSKTWESPTPPCALLICWACSDSSKSRGWNEHVRFCHTRTHITYHLIWGLQTQYKKQKQQKAQRKLLPRCTKPLTCLWHVGHPEMTRSVRRCDSPWVDGSKNWRPNEGFLPSARNQIPCVSVTLLVVHQNEVSPAPGRLAFCSLL